MAERHRIPAVYSVREFVTAGGLMSYGDVTARIVQALRRVDRLASSRAPSLPTFPMQQASKVELLINLKTAKALGLTIPITLLGRADEVIE